MPKAVKKLEPAVQEDDEDLAKEDYQDKDKFEEEILEEDDDESVEDGEEAEEESTSAIDVADDL